MKRSAVEFSPFYNREFSNKKSESEQRQVFRWFQLIEKHCLLYNVSNGHDCIRADREEKELARLARREPHPIVVQPFPSVSTFFGCLVCGKYHLCRSTRESCVIICDSVDKRQSCAYSGNILPVQDNLVVANFDEDRRTETEAIYASMPSYQTNRPNVSAKQKRVQKKQVLELFNNNNDNASTQTQKPSKKRRRISKTAYQDVIKDVYEISLESMSEEDERGDDDEDTAFYTCAHEDSDTNDECHEEHKSSDDEDAEEEGGGGDKKKPTKKMRKRANEEDEGEESSSLYEDADDEEQEEERKQKQQQDEENKGKVVTGATEDNEAEERDWFDEVEHVGGEDDDEDGGGGSGGTEYDNENGDGSHAKNYHNNIRYKNDYYAFLRGVIKKKKKVATVTGTNDRYTEFIDLYKRDMREDEPFYSCDSRQAIKDGEDDDDEPPLSSFSEKRLSESVCNKIEEEVGSIIKTLLKIDPVSKRPKCTIKESVVHDTLTAYFATLVKNVTLLVYQSPVLERLAQERAAKNHAQVNKFSISTIDITGSSNNVTKPQDDDVDHHEVTLCPRKIAHALLLRLFLKPLPMSVHGYRILVWGRDEWLRSFNDEKNARNLLNDFYDFDSSSSVDKSKGIGRFEKELNKTATRILDCLAHYNMCPLWVRDILFRGVA